MTLIEQLKRHEGFKSRPYKCTSGVLTFGYGLTFISREEAEVVLAMRVDWIRNLLGYRLDGLSTTRKNVIINMAYNLGVEGLLDFKKMWAAIDVGDFDTAATEMIDSKWSKQVGKRAVELADMMLNG